MTPRPQPRQSPCGRVEAAARLAQADAYLAAARLVVDDRADLANSGVAGALAVLAGIAAADAACCARLSARARGQDHREATALVATVAPHGPAMAKDLGRLLDRKDSVHYGAAMISTTEGARMVGWAARLVDHAHTAVEA
jgi:hypothetical protein